VTHFIAGLGTSGTFVGTTRRLKELNPFIRCISFQPDSPFNGLEGLKHMATAIKPGIYDSYVADDDVPVKTEEAYRMARILARQEGLFVGISSAAAVAAAVQVARQQKEAVVVTILPDNGFKYLSERFWNEH
jgi:cysteine synthase B